MKNSIMDTKFDRRILLLNKIIIVFIPNYAPLI
ncbi:ABC transporter permease [Streptococcus pneumoniae]|nr:ABC transporter permease [Streptococcus pneumoniae]CJH15190.1 ABC transporter permease [Streptococcus pneumoniae]CJV93451.1 ABC transporter permease [Streptococcus pneumoniae]